MRKEDGTVNEVEPEEVLNAVHPVRGRKWGKRDCQGGCLLTRVGAVLGMVYSHLT